MDMLSKDGLFLLEQVLDIVILADIETKRICFWNQSAAKNYGIDEKTYSLEDIFQHCPMTLHEMIQKMRSEYNPEEPMTVFSNLFTMKPDGSEQFADLTISYANEEQTILCFRLYLREDIRMSVATEMIVNGVKPLFLADINEEMDIFFANELFYTTFTKNKEAFESYYKNSFMATMLDTEQTSFYKKLRNILFDKKSFREDIQISTVHGVRKWFLLELQIIHIGNSDIKILGSMLPIAERIQVANRLEQMNQYLEAIQELTTGALFYINAKGTKLTHHSLLLKKRGLANEMDLYPKCVLPLIHDDDCADFLLFSDQMVQGSRETFQFRYKTDSKNFSWAKINCIPICDEEGNILELVGRVQNIDAEKELVDRATIDPLTNAYNKEYAREVIENIIEQAQPDMVHAFFFMDLDNFKYVNDNLGHTFGDFLLQELGCRLAKQLRSDDVIGRVGGDEFIFFLKNVKKIEILLTKANNLLETIGTSFNDGTIEHTIHGSIGIAVYPIHGKTYDDLYLNADLALYRSKHRGKNMATIFKPPVNKKSTKEIPEIPSLQTEALGESGER